MKYPQVFTRLKIVSEVPYTMGDQEGTPQIDYDGIRKKTKLILTRFGGTFGTLRFDERSFFNFFWFTHYWDYEPINAIHADSPGVYTSGKNLYLCTNDKIHSKCDVIDSSIVNELRQPNFYSFILDKPARYNVFCEPGSFHYKRINKSVVNSLTVYLENENHEEVNFNGETLTFTLQMIKF